MYDNINTTKLFFCETGKDIFIGNVVNHANYIVYTKIAVSKTLVRTISAKIFIHIDKNEILKISQYK